MMTTRSELCFRGINVVYRNSVVRHIRSALMSKYPDDWLDKLRRPFKSEEWSQIQRNAEVVRISGIISTPLSDDFDILSVNHFYNLFEAYFDDLFPEVSELSEINRRSKRQNLLGWTRHIKSMRDPVTGHPSETDVSVEDALSVLDSARRVLESIDHESANQIHKLWEQIRITDIKQIVDDVGSERVIESSTLPSREFVVPSFVGRQKELEALSDWMHDEHSHLNMLAGDGGKGKTAIAYEFAVSIVNEPPGRT